MHRIEGRLIKFLRRDGVAFCARLIVFSLAMQITAIDHWQPAVAEEVSGVVGSSLHEMHCHGGAAGCGDTQAAVNVAATQPLTAIPAVWTQRGVVEEATSAESLSVAPLDHPPRFIAII